MQRRKNHSLRNKLDLTDAKQVRLVRKRLRLSEAELAGIVGKIGNSIAAISKEATVQRARQLPEPEQIPVATVAVSTTKTAVSTEPNA